MRSGLEPAYALRNRMGARATGSKRRIRAARSGSHQFQRPRMAQGRGREDTADDRRVRRRCRAADTVDLRASSLQRRRRLSGTSASKGDSGPVPMPASSSFSRRRAGPAFASESARGLRSRIEEAATTSAASTAVDATGYRGTDRCSAEPNDRVSA